eukprot:2626661-Pyramimonas_sp.AAC.1
MESGRVSAARKYVPNSGSSPLGAFGKQTSVPRLYPCVPLSLSSAYACWSASGASSRSSCMATPRRIETPSPVIALHAAKGIPSGPGDASPAARIACSTSHRRTRHFQASLGTACRGRRRLWRGSPGCTSVSCTSSPGAAERREPSHCRISLMSTSGALKTRSQCTRRASAISSALSVTSPLSVCMAATVVLPPGSRRFNL